MENVKAFLKRKNIVIDPRRYGNDALGAMAQGLFCSLLVGTILNTIGSQFHIGFLTAQIITINEVGYTIGGMASFMSGAAMAAAIGYALQAPPMVLFSLATVGYACNALGKAGGPLAVLFVAIIAAECGKAVSKETKIDILVTPIVTTLVGIGTARAAPPSSPGPAAAIQPRAKGAAPPAVCPAVSAAERKKRTPRCTSRPARSRSNISCPCATACPSSKCCSPIVAPEGEETRRERCREDFPGGKTGWKPPEGCVKEALI